MTMRKRLCGVDDVLIFDISEGNLHGEGRADAHGAFESDTASQDCGELRADAETKASTAKFSIQAKISLDKWLKYFCLHVFGYTGTGILNLECEKI